MFGCVDTKLLAPSVGPLITAVHRQITAIISISVTVAMYCLLQMYFCVAEELAPHRPILKLFAVKAVGMFLHMCPLLGRSRVYLTVFLTFWQATFLSLLSVAGVVKDVWHLVFLEAVYPIN